MAEFPQLLHTVLDTTRPRELAEFYRQLLGLRSRPRPRWRAGWAKVLTARSAVAFQDCA
jgi:hypothetical protein